MTMEQNKTRKIAFTSAEFVGKEKRQHLFQHALLDILAIAVSLFSIVYTIGTAIAYNTITLGFWLFMLFIAVFLLGVSTILVITTIQANVELFCLLAGKYKIEIDRVTQIDLKNTRKQPSNVFAHAPR